MNEILVRAIIETTIRNRSDIAVYKDGATDRIMEVLDLTLSQDKLIAELIGRLSCEELPRA